jgi:hypothetical protein
MVVKQEEAKGILVSAFVEIAFSGIELRIKYIYPSVQPTAKSLRVLRKLPLVPRHDSRASCDFSDLDE